MVNQTSRPQRVAHAALVVFVLLLGAISARGAGAQAPAKVVVGALPFTSSGPLFLAANRGYFRDEDLDVEVAFFQAAPPIAVATASNEVTFGITALTAAAYNLAAEGQLVVVAGQAQEKKGFTGNLILVGKAAYDRGLDRLDALFDQPFGLTQLGSPSHYQLGQLADARGIATTELDVRAFQTLPNLIAALKSGAVTWAIIAPPIATDLIDAGAVVSLGPYSDYGSFQFGAVLASDDTLRDHPDLTRAFLRAYAKGLADYVEIVEHPDSAPARAAAEVVGGVVYPGLAPGDAARTVLGSAFYVDPTGQVEVEDLRRQVAWYHANGMLNSLPDPADFLRLDFLP
jgi:NitT/TauT family transport system substrate-binding protein